MKKGWNPSLCSVLVLLVLFLSVRPSHSAGPSVNCLPVTGNPPVIDGAVAPNEWPSAAQITIASPIQTNVYCLNDTSNLYILVDALGDTTDDNQTSPCDQNSFSSCDECLLVFNNGNSSGNFLAEVWGKAGNIVGTNANFPANAQVAIGFNGHRFYEWKIPLASINASPGQAVLFSSPRLCKGGGSGEFCVPTSMPYDGSTGADNEWPAGIDLNDKTTWAQIQLNGNVATVPTLNEWGLLVFTLLAGMGSVYFLRKQRRATE